MKTNTAIAFLACCYSVAAQGTFQNLDFESASISPSTKVDFPVPISDALPNWNVYFTSITATVPQSDVNYDSISLGGTDVSIIDHNSPGFGPIAGQYSVALFGGSYGNLTVPTGLFSAEITQAAVVPSGTQFLEIDAAVSGAPFSVTLGGQTIPMTPIQTFTHYTLYGGNIPSGMASQTETLSFVEPPATDVQPSMFELDNISFSPTAVASEPSPLLLTEIGGILFVVYRRFARKHP